MKDKVIQVSKFIVFLGIGLFLIWLVYGDEDIDKLLTTIKSTNYRWIWLSMFLGLLSHMSRAKRWNILIEPLGYKPKFLNTFFAVMVMYLANTAIPRSGEVTRCGILKQYEKVPVGKLFGTVFIERLIDMIFLVVLLGVVLLTQFEVMIEFFTANVSTGIIDKLTSPIVIGGGVSLIIVGLVFIFVFRKYVSHTIIYKKIKEFILNFWSGIKSIRNMKNKLEFMFHSVFIYVMYFLMIYVCFFAFEFTTDLSVLIGLAVFVMASLGMVAPSPGGVGTWHFMAIGTLLIYQIDPTDAKAFAFVVHSSQMLMLVVVGFFSLIALPIYNRKNRKVDVVPETTKS